MSEQYDPNTNYDLIEAEDIKVGEVRQGVCSEGTWENAGKVDGDVFHYNGRPAGAGEGLTVTRNDTDNSLTQFQLVPQKNA